jgi:predicted ribosome quality control (RQC) complex YloA/Tae2 family protein
VSGVARVAERDDLLLFFDGGDERRVLHVVPGGARGRVTLTARRFARDELQTGPRVDRLNELLRGARLKQGVQPAGERRCSLVLATADGRRSLEVELFGNRGLWALLDAGGRIVELSHLGESKDRTLEPGAVYAPPASRAQPPAPPRFAPPVLDAIDRHFTELDEAGERTELRAVAARALERAIRGLRKKVEGLDRQAEEARAAPELRRQGDLLLTYAHLWRRGLERIEAPDPEDASRTVAIPCDPLQPPPLQAQACYDRARRIEEGVEVGRERRAAAAAQLAALETLQAELAGADDARAQAIHAELARQGLVAAPDRAAAAPKAPVVEKRAKGEAFRRFTSAEGHPILAGKTNEQNDKLSLRVANGNDLWFHVGRGYAGSHVIVRVPRGKTASLETLLDAATLAVHFSKARGVSPCDVVYTLAKFVRKPKGAPPGQVTISQEKSLRVRLEPARLQRLLGGGGA